MKRRTLMAAMAAATASFSPLVRAQKFPDKPIRLVVPFPPGGGADAVSRLFGQRLAEVVGTSVVIENRGGAGGTIGSEQVAKSPADGYTLLIGPASHVISPSFFKVSTDPISGFVPISQLVNASIALAAPASLPEATLKELLAKARQDAKLATVATAGSGTVFHLSAARLGSAAGVDLQHIAYKGGGPAIIDLVAGRVPMMIDTYFTFQTYFKAGRVKPLATLGRTRSPLLPDVPTLVELGYKDVVATNWYGLFAPASTPDAVVNYLYEKTRLALTGPEVAQRFQQYGAEIVASNPAEFRQFAIAEREKWQGVIKANNIKAE
ncbi:MAG: tripartite tricarboxylate transporter substrate binding protein [Burkholderiaceae bacterium]